MIRDSELVTFVAIVLTLVPAIVNTSILALPFGALKVNAIGARDGFDRARSDAVTCGASGSWSLSPGGAAVWWSGVKRAVRAASCANCGQGSAMGGRIAPGIVHVTI